MRASARQVLIPIKLIRGGVRQVAVLRFTAPGTGARPGIGVFSHGGAMPRTGGGLLMSGMTMLGCIKPMSSPMMNMMSGLPAGPCASAGVAAKVTAENDANKVRGSRILRAISCFTSSR